MTPTTEVLEQHDVDAPAADPTALRVLVIDDDPDSVAVISHLLRVRAGAAVTAAAGPRQALALLATTTFDVVVTDVHMPAMNGLQVLDLLHVTAPQTAVVVVTADIGTRCALDVLTRQSAGFLFKPLDPRELVDTVRIAGARAA